MAASWQRGLETSDEISPVPTCFLRSTARETRKELTCCSSQANARRRQAAWGGGSGGRLPRSGGGRVGGGGSMGGGRQRTCTRRRRAVESLRRKLLPLQRRRPWLSPAPSPFSRRMNAGAPGSTRCGSSSLLTRVADDGDGDGGRRGGGETAREAGPGRLRVSGGRRRGPPLQLSRGR
jgi:hypothetical protein